MSDTQTSALKLNGPSFGRRATAGPAGGDLLNLMLGRRLRQKIGSYERAARTLRASGEADAADVLQRAACRLRHLTVGG